jgi:hypothetical protein
LLGTNHVQSLAILARMGEVLVQIQMTERVLKICINYFVPGLDVSWESLLDNQHKTEKWTLGAFLNELRKRRDIDAGFDDVLRSLLKDRNDFIHNIFSVPGFEISADAQPDKAMEFLNTLSQRAQHVRNVLRGYVDLIAEALGLTETASKPLDITNSDDFHKITALLAIKAK